MSLLIESEPTPLEVDANGVVLVGGTRITLDTIVAAFSQGATAEEITHQYPSLHPSGCVRCDWILSTAT